MNRAFVTYGDSRMWEELQDIRLFEDRVVSRLWKELWQDNMMDRRLNWIGNSSIEVAERGTAERNKRMDDRTG